jgi:hypothetical protein
MNYNFFLKIKNFQGLIIPLILLSSPISYAQNNEAMTPTKSQIMTQKDLDAINNAPIAQTVYAKERVMGSEKRPKSYDYQDESGTKIEEYRDIGQNVDIQVDSSMGTHYQMAPLGDKDTISSPQTLNRVPSIKLPF